MSNYTKSTDFAAKDSLPTGNPGKIIKGTEIDTEFNNLAIAIATKADSAASGSGNVVGPASSNVGAIATFGNTDGTLLANNSAATISSGTITATGFSGNGSALTSLNAGNISSGTLSASRLPSTAQTTDTAQTVSGEKTFTGTIGVGATNPAAGWNLYCQQNSTNPGAVFFNNNSSGWAQANVVGSGITQLVLFQKSSTSAATGTLTDVGSITTSGSSTSYNTSSDYRLKTDVVPLTNAVTRLKQLSPYRFKWIAMPDAPAVDGFLAHEVSPVVPESIVGEKDAVKPDGSIKPQAIDQAKLVPLLVAALQEAIARIEVLEAR
jgi:hypothetical protein